MPALKKLITQKLVMTTLWVLVEFFYRLNKYTPISWGGGLSAKSNNLKTKLQVLPWLKSGRIGRVNLTCWIWAKLWIIVSFILTVLYSPQVLSIKKKKK